MTEARVLPPHATPASRHRLTLARELVRFCPPELGLEIALTGSVARGVADSLSDIEINLWVERLPEAGAWTSWLEGAGIDRSESIATPFHDDGWLWTGCRYRGIWVEIGWHELAKFDSLVERLATGAERHGRRLQLGWILLSAVPLRTAGALARWQERLRHYPDELASAIITDNVAAWSDPHVPPVRWALAARDQRFGLAGRLHWDVQNILAILGAVNRRWPQDWKWTDERSLDFPVKPKDLAERINAIFTLSDPRAAVRTCFDLILDTLALVPPEIDVTAARSSVRAALAGEPPLTRACAAVIRGDAILMVECRHATHSHWTLPGGRIEEGEAPTETALRELAEEARVHGEAPRLLYTRPWGRSHGEGLEACFLVEIPADVEPQLGSDPELEEQGQELVGVAWRPLAELAGDPQVSTIIERLRRA